MSKKKLNKKVWYSSEVDVSGNPILPPLADNPKDLEGLHEGELFLHNSDDYPSIWIRTKSGLIKPLIGGQSNTPSYWEVKELPNGDTFLYTSLPIVTQSGVTMYADGGNLNLPSIYDGLPIDNNTIYWENGILKAKGGGGIESITKQMVIDALGFTPYSAANPNGYITAASIPSALKNPYALTFGSKTYDGSSAKEITASDLGAALSSDLSKYLPLSGGTISGKLIITHSDYDDILTIKRIHQSGNSIIKYSNKTEFLGHIGVYGSAGTFPYNPIFADKDGNQYKIWHSGNDGSGSGLDADTLDGVHASKLYQVNSAVDLGGTTSNYDTLIVRYSNTSATSNHPYSIVGGNQCVALNLYAGTDYAAQLAVGFGTNYLAYRRKINSTSWQSWVKINAGLADEATKLQTARTIWGQSFDGTGDVSGTLKIPNDYTLRWFDNAGADINGMYLSNKNEFFIGNGAAAKGYNTYLSGKDIIFSYGKSRKEGVRINSSGNVGIGTASPAYKLDVNGVISANSTTNQVFVGSSTYTYGVIRATQILSPTLTSSFGIGHIFGKELNNKNCGNITFNWSSSGNDLNRVSIGLYGADNLLNILGNGTVGIGIAYPSAKLHVVGDILATGGVTMYSQRILKNIVDERGLSLTELSAIKPIRYKWKDKRDDRIHFGGIADDIEKVLPEVIYTASDGTLTMDYGNAGFAIASSLIKPVIDHEERIKALERENEMLKQELNRLRA